jgi:hypothetical protein
MKREPHSKHTFAITDCKLIATWSDGKTEDLSATLPDYLREEIERYLDEMDDLRTQHPEDYSVVMEGEAMKVKVYFEGNAGAHMAAQFDEDETYMACLPALETLAKSKGYIVTESVNYEGESK